MEDLIGSSDESDEVTFLLRLKPTAVAPTPPIRRRHLENNNSNSNNYNRGVPKGWDVVVETPPSPRLGYRRLSCCETPPPPVPPRIIPTAPPQEAVYEWGAAAGNYQFASRDYVMPYSGHRHHHEFVEEGGFRSHRQDLITVQGRL